MVQDYYSAYFAAEIFHAVVSNGDGRKKGQKPTGAEVIELVHKLFGQECVGLIPDKDQEHLSYISLIADGDVFRSSITDLIAKASDELLPVQLDPGNGFVPYEKNFTLSGLNQYSCTTGWKEIPGYGSSTNQFPEKAGYKPWFGVFSDTVGIFLYFYYPKEPSGVIEVPYEGVDLGGFKIYWKHGVPGLAKIMQIVFFEWLVRNFSYGLVIET